MIEDLYNVKDKVAVVTGSSRGIGKQCALAFAEAGAKLVLNYVSNKEAAEITAEEIADLGSEAIVVQADVKDFEACQTLGEEAIKAYGQVDFLVNNAGYGFTEDFDSYDLEKLDGFLNVLLNSLVKLTRLFIKDMKERNSGKILQVSSIAGIIPSGSGAIGIYGNIKNFVNEFTITLNSTYKKYNVHVCALCPGFTETGFNERAGFNMQYSDVPSLFLMSAKQVAEQGVNACLKGKEIYVVRGGFNKTMIFISKFIPNKILRFLFGSLVNFGK